MPKRAAAKKDSAATMDVDQPAGQAPGAAAKKGSKRRGRDDEDDDSDDGAGTDTEVRSSALTSL